MRRLEQHYFIQGAIFALRLSTTDLTADQIRDTIIAEAEKRWPEFDPAPIKGHPDTEKSDG